ncbi:hypothetical protein K0U07_05585 [bacterium]|nr:hypothetical protein [bacterium]
MDRTSRANPSTAISTQDTSEEQKSVPRVKDLVIGICDPDRSLSLRVWDGVALFFYIITGLAFIDLGCLLLKKVVDETKHSLALKKQRRAPIEQRMVNEVKASIQRAINCKKIVLCDRIMHHPKIENLIKKGTKLIMLTAKNKAYELARDKGISVSVKALLESDEVSGAIKAIKAGATTAGQKALGVYTDPKLTPLPAGPTAEDITEEGIQVAVDKLLDEKFGIEHGPQRLVAAAAAAGAAESKAEDPEDEELEHEAAKMVRKMMAQALGILPPDPVRPADETPPKTGILHDRALRAQLGEVAVLAQDEVAGSMVHHMGLQQPTADSPMGRLTATLTQAVYAGMADRFGLPVDRSAGITLPGLGKKYAMQKATEYAKGTLLGQAAMGAKRAAKGTWYEKAFSWVF